MTKERFFTITTIVLLILNTATLVFLFTERHAPGMGGNPRQTGDYIIKELQLTETQQKQFETLKNAHQDALKTIRQEDGRLHDEYFELLKTNPQNRQLVDSITGLIGKQRQAVELAMFDHFARLRGICNAEQQVKLNSIIDKIARRLSPKPEAGPPPPPRP